MAKRAALTLIFLGAHRTDRVDLGPAPGFAVLEQSHKAARGSDDPAERVEASLVSTPRIGKVVWVLWEGASAQVLDMPNGVVQGMEREQLAGALGFEAEPLTGVPAAESAIDGVQQKGADGVLPEFRRFWITQLTSEVRDKIEQVVTARRSKIRRHHPSGRPPARPLGQLAAHSKLRTNGGASKSGIRSRSAFTALPTAALIPASSAPAVKAGRPSFPPRARCRGWPPDRRPTAEPAASACLIRSAWRYGMR